MGGKWLWLALMMATPAAAHGQTQAQQDRLDQVGKYLGV